MCFHSWTEALHIISVISWMCAMLYLPRIFVYHSKAEHKSEMAKTFTVMEGRLFKFIATPAMILTVCTGLILAHLEGLIPMTTKYPHGWFHLKFLCVIILLIMHFFCYIFYQKFKKTSKVKSSRFFKIFNEMITILMITIVIMVVVKPF